MKLRLAQNPVRPLVVAALLALCMAADAGCATDNTPAPLGATVCDADRSFRDYAFSAAGGAPHAAALRIRLAEPLPRGKVRAATVYLKSGEGWHAAAVGATDSLCACRPVRVPLTAFSAEGTPGAIGESTAVRVAAWNGAGFTNEIVLGEAAFVGPARIAIVRSTERTAPGEAAIASEMANRCAAIATKAGRDFDFIGDDFTELSPKDGGAEERPSVVFLPYSPKLSDDDAKALAAFARSGGKLVVFYCGNRELGKALGVEPGPWRDSGRRAYTAIDASPLMGAPRRIPHFTEGVIPPRPIPDGGARKIATWISEYVKPTHSTAATLSPRGAWFAHVPPRAYPAAVDFFNAILKDLAPDAGEPHSVADDEAGTGSGPANAGPAPLPLSAWANSPEIPLSYGDRLGGLGLKALYIRHKPGAPFPAKLDGVEVHAWVSCFTTEGLDEKLLEKLAREKRLSATTAGWLDPANRKNGKLAVSRLVEIARSGVAGVHLDYVRSDDAAGRNDATADAITDFVREASKAVREAAPGVEISAAVFPTPESAARRNQDWPKWIEEGLVDYVCPMAYTESPDEFAMEIESCRKVAPADKILAGIGSGANESQVDAETASAELAIAAEAGCRGAVFFTLNDSLDELLEALRK